MSSEDFNGKMEFIIEQQAQFAADIQQLREAQARTDQMLNRLAAVTLEGFKDVNAKIDALADSQLRLQEAQERTSENVRGIGEDLKNLIAIVDGYFRERNGRAES